MHGRLPKLSLVSAAQFGGRSLCCCKNSFFGMNLQGFGSLKNYVQVSSWQNNRTLFISSRTSCCSSIACSCLAINLLILCGRVFSCSAKQWPSEKRKLSPRTVFRRDTIASNSCFNSLLRFSSDKKVAINCGEVFSSWFVFENSCRVLLPLLPLGKLNWKEIMWV